jgi:hypothetical protein
MATIRTGKIPLVVGSPSPGSVDLKYQEPKNQVEESPQNPLRPSNFSIKVLLRVKRWIITFYDQNGNFPSIDTLSKKTNLSKGKITDILKELLETGFLEKKGTRYSLGQSPEIEKLRQPVLIAKATAALKLSPAMVFMKILLFLIGCGATFMSIFHSTDFLKEYYSTTNAILSGIIMICFNILAFEMIVFFRQKRYFGFANVFIVVMVLGTIFSMGSTIIGMYNARASELTVQYQDENAQDLNQQEIEVRYNLLLQKKEAALNLLEGERLKRDGMVELLNSYTSDMIENDLENYNKLNGRRYIADTRVDTALEEYSAILEEEREFLENNVVTVADARTLPSDAYHWIAGEVFEEANPELLQFWMSVYPALFYDLIAPLSFSIVFFVTGKAKERKRKPDKRKRKRGFLWLK